jgi:EAL domain-containing protein (putative c-di-GMP-specific phosphodiesterase class I)
MLIHLIYSSVSRVQFRREDLIELLQFSQQNNASIDVTGMLLYADNSFMQILEGDEEQVMRLYEKLERDKRHQEIVIIAKESIAKRSFGEWSMGYADITPEEVDAIIGANDVLVGDHSFTKIEVSRAKKLIAAFRHGSWRARITNLDIHTADIFPQSSDIQAAVKFSPAIASSPPNTTLYSFAYQPILNARTGQVFAYEALLRGRNNQSPQQVFESVPTSEINQLDNESRLVAIHLAAHLGLSTHLNLNVIPSSVVKFPAAISKILETAAQYKILPEQIILEILESEAIDDISQFAQAIRPYRSTGLLFAIDDFGAGQANLNLLAEFQPDYIKLDRLLISRINTNGPRQAIIRGILRTCFDLGIDIIAEGVETESEYRWLMNTGINLFQGYLIAKPKFEELTTNYFLPKGIFL